MNIICLDIDDCIFINDSTYAGKAEDALDLLEIKDENYIFLKTNGLIDNSSIYKIRQFIEKK